MKPIIFSQASIFHLYRLGHVVTGITGKRYHLEKVDEMYSLIRYCDRSDNKSISTQFSAFLSTVDEGNYQQMAEKGLLQKMLERPDQAHRSIA